MSDLSPATEAPESVTAFLEKLDSNLERLPKRLRQCGEFTRRHLHLIAVSTVSDMARSCEVAPSVYMRFCQAMGFTGYSEMQALFRADYVEFRPDYEQRLTSLQALGGDDVSQLVHEFAEAGHKSLLSISNTVTPKELERTARAMSEARVVHLVGLRRALAVVSNMSYLLGKLDVPNQLHFETGMLNSGGSIFPDDVLIAVTFFPFSPEVISFAKSCSERGLRVFGISDTESCPIGEFAEEMLIVREHEVAGFRSLTAVTTLTTALAVAVRSLRNDVDRG